MRTGFSVRVLWSALAAFCVSSASPARAQPPKDAPEPEHTVWVKIISNPPGADLYAAPPGDQAPSARIGSTPCTVAVDFTWGRSWFKRRWDRIAVWSPGNVCRAVLQKDASYDLYLSVAAEKKGCETKKAEAKVGTLQYPGNDWSRTAQWPAEGRLTLDLEPVKGQAAAEVAEPARPAQARKVVVAGGLVANAPVNTGTLMVSANVDGADVFVDQQYLGAAPIQVVIREGPHVVQLQKVGLKSVRKQIHVDSDTEVSYRAVLAP